MPMKSQSDQIDQLLKAGVDVSPSEKVTRAAAIIFMCVLGGAFGCSDVGPRLPALSARHADETTTGADMQPSGDAVVAIVAVVESCGLFAPDHSGESLPSAPVRATILRVTQSPVSGPNRVILFFSEEPAAADYSLFTAPGRRLKIMMKVRWFRAAAFTGAVVEGGERVFIPSVQAVSVVADDPK